MNFEINKQKYKIIELPQNKIRKELDERAKEQIDGDLTRGRYMGVTLSDIGVIYLDSDITLDKQKNVLIHELAHAYIDAYVHHFERYDEEAVCDIVANSHYIIREIIDKYYSDRK